MTQQQFYPQFPGQPMQQPVPQGYPQQGYAPTPQPGYPGAFPQQGYAPQAPPQAPAQPLANGTLDDFYNQPTSGGGPGIKWTNPDGSQKPIGTSYSGIVARDVTHGDVQQITNPQGVPQFYRDGKPKFQMKVALLVQHPEFPTGEATFYVKGQSKDELNRAMAAAGLEGSPKAGDAITVTLTQRRPNPGMQPTNVVQIQYARQGGQAPAAPQAAPAVPAQPAQVQQQYVQQVQPDPSAVALPGVSVQPQQYVQQQQPVAQAPAAQAPVQQPIQPGALPAPETLSPAQQALFAQLAAGQQQAPQG